MADEAFQETISREIRRGGSTSLSDPGTGEALVDGPAASVRPVLRATAGSRRVRSQQASIPEMPQACRALGTLFEDTPAQKLEGVASVIELAQQPVCFVDARLEAGEIESRHLIEQAETLALRFGQAQKASRVLQLPARGVKVALVQIRASGEQRSVRLE